MDPTWLERIGMLAQALFAVLVGALLIAGAMRAAWGAARPSTIGSRVSAAGRGVRRPLFGPIDRCVWEYVGNLALDGSDGAGGSGRLDDRRGNGEPRALIEQIIREMDRCRVSALVRETFLDDLHRAMRSEERLRELGLAGRETEQRFLETERWALAERFHSIVEDPPPDLVARIRSGLQSAAAAGSDAPDPPPG